MVNRQAKKKEHKGNLNSINKITRKNKTTKGTPNLISEIKRKKIFNKINQYFFLNLKK